MAKVMLVSRDGQRRVSEKKFWEQFRKAAARMRKRQRVTQKEMAVCCDYNDKQSVSNVENGRQRPDAWRALLMASRLGGDMLVMAGVETGKGEEPKR